MICNNVKLCDIIAGDTTGMECLAQAGENADSIFKIIDTQKKHLYLPGKGEAEGWNKHQKDDVEFVTSDVRFCNGDKGTVRNKLIIKYVLQGNFQAYKKKKNNASERKNGHIVWKGSWFDNNYHW